MLLPGAAKKVIIHLNEDTTSAHDFLCDKDIFAFLYQRGVSGATMIRPHAGFGSHHRVHTTGAGSVEGEHLPVRIEFLESAEVVDSILQPLCDLVSDGVIEVQSTTIVKTVTRI
jgi:PII-like signaling protein